MFCNNCGTKLPDSAVFCNNCGAKLPKQPSQQPQPQQQLQQRLQQQIQQQNRQPQQPLRQAPAMGTAAGKTVKKAGGGFLKKLVGVALAGVVVVGGVNVLKDVFDTGGNPEVKPPKTSVSTTSASTSAGTSTSMDQGVVLSAGAYTPVDEFSINIQQPNLCDEPDLETIICKQLLDTPLVVNEDGSFFLKLEGSEPVTAGNNGNGDYTYYYDYQLEISGKLDRDAYRNYHQEDAGPCTATGLIHFHKEGVYQYWDKSEEEYGCDFSVAIDCSGILKANHLWDPWVNDDKTTRDYMYSTLKGSILSEGTAWYQKEGKDKETKIFREEWKDMDIFYSIQHKD